MNRIEAAGIAFSILFVIVFIIDYFFVNKKYYKKIIGKTKKKK